MRNEPVESVLREGRCMPNCLLALGDESNQCRCRCRGSYHGVLSDSMVEKRFDIGIVDEWWTHFCCLGPQKELSLREARRFYPETVFARSDRGVALKGNFHEVIDNGHSFTARICDIGNFEEGMHAGLNYYLDAPKGPQLLDLFLSSLRKQRRAIDCRISKCPSPFDSWVCPFSTYVEITGIRDACEAFVICEAIWRAIGISSGGGCSMDMLMSSICLVNNYWDECLESHRGLFVFSSSGAAINTHAVIPFGLSDEELWNRWEERMNYYEESE